MIKTIGKAMTLFAAAHLSATAATITPVEYPDGSRLLSLAGPIVPGDDANLQAQLDQAHRLGVKFLAIALSSPGGNVMTGWSLAKIVRTRQLATVVADNGQCMSACFYVFAAGVNRFATTSARIGVHSAAINGKETDDTKVVTLDKARQLFHELDVPAAIVGALMMTGPDDIYILSPTDLASMHVDFLPTPAAEAPKLAEVPTPQKQTEVEVEHSASEGRRLNTQALAASGGGDIERAVELSRRAATVSPLDPEILANLGYFYLKMGRLEDADASLQIAAQLRPSRAITWQNLGLVAAARGQQQRATEYFVRYLQSDRSGGPAQRQLLQWAADASLPTTQRNSAARALDAVSIQKNWSAKRLLQRWMICDQRQ